MTNTYVNAYPISSQIAPLSNIYSSIYQFYNDSFTFSNFNYALKLNRVILGASNSIATFSQIAEIFIPPSPNGGIGLFSPADYLRDFYYYTDDYIYLSYAGFTLNNGPFVSYNIQYGQLWNPELQIAAIQKFNIFTGFRIGFTFSQPHGLTAGDKIFVSAEDPIVSGESTILSTGFTNYNFAIDRIWATPSVSTGYITSAKRYPNNFTPWENGWNATNQYKGRFINYNYLIAGNNNTRPDGSTQKFLSTYGDKLFTNFITGTGSIISKKANQFETIGFIVDPYELYSNTTGSLILQWDIYSATNSVLGTFSYNFGPGGDSGIFTISRWEANVGYDNLAGLGFFNGSEKYWNVYFKDSSDNSIISEIRQYVIDDECSSYDKKLVAWINSLGSLEYFTFTQNNKISYNINRNDWKKELNIGLQAMSVDRGRGILSQVVKQNIVLNSNWIDENDYAWLSELTTSQFVWIFEDYYENDLLPIPVNVVDTSYEFKKQKTEQIFNFTITLEYSNDIWTSQSK